MEQRLCPICNNPLIKRKNESNARFAKKRCCSTKCSRQWLKDHKIGWFSQAKKDEIFLKLPPREKLE